MDANTPTTKSITEQDLLRSMEQESMWDTLLEEFVMPMPLYEQIKVAQREWQAWMDAKAVELAIDPAKVNEARNY